MPRFHYTVLGVLVPPASASASAAGGVPQVVHLRNPLGMPHAWSGDWSFKSPLWQNPANAVLRYVRVCVRAYVRTYGLLAPAGWMHGAWSMHTFCVDARRHSHEPFDCSQSARGMIYLSVNIFFLLFFFFPRLFR